MPRVPNYQPNQVGPVQITEARLRPANNNGGALGGLGEGLRELGGAVSDFAVAQHRIDVQYDEQQARQLALEYKSAADPLVTEFTNLAGKNAVDLGSATQERLNQLQADVAAKAANERQKRYLNGLLAPAATEYQGSVGTHAAKQQRVMGVTTAKSEIDMATNHAAAAYEDPTKLALHRAEASAAVKRLGALEGWDAATIASEDFKAGSDIHSSVLSQQVVGEDIDMATAYFDAHQDEMTAAARNDAMRLLKAPLELRDSVSGFSEIVSGAPASVASPSEIPAGSYKMPVPGTVTSAYGSKRGNEIHTGTDIAAALGSAIKPIASGRVVEVGQDARSGRYVKVAHPDGHVSSYAHMGNQSVKVGDSIGADTVIGTVGMTGHTTGPHVHLVVRDGAGNRIDPQSVMGKQAPGGKVLGSPQEARNWDQATVIAEIDKRTDWTLEKRERVKDYARKRMGQDEQILADRRSDADERASEYVLSQREGFVDTARIPRAVWNSLSPSDKQKYEDVAKRNREPKEAKPNGPDVMTLNQMRFYDEEGFKALNLGQYQGKVSKGELDSLLSQQAKMRTEKPTEWTPRAGIVTALNYGKRIGGLKLDDGDEASIMRIMEAEANALYQQNGKKPLTEMQYQDLFRSATRNVRTTGWISSTDRPRYQLPASTMPDSTRQRLTAQFTSQMGRAPTDEELLQLFRVNTR